MGTAAGRTQLVRGGHYHSLRKQETVQPSLLDIPTTLVLQEEEEVLRRSRDDPTVVLRSLEKLWTLSPTAEDLGEGELLGVLYCRIYPEYTVDTVQGKLVRKLLRRYEALFKDLEV